MAVKLGAMDTHIVWTALLYYRETLKKTSPERMTPGIQARIDSVDRLLKAYTRSYHALDRLGIM